MIRRAILSDLQRLFELLMETHAASKYAKWGISVDETTAKSVLLDGVRRNGGTHNGATLLNVVEKNGKVEGFMFCLLQRVHSVGNRLEAQDLWLYCSPKAPKIALSKLIDAYVEWADGSAKVAEIALSWTDAVPIDGVALGKVYARKGFHPAGEIWKRASQ